MSRLPPAGTLREPFFKRRRDGGFYFESGAALAGPAPLLSRAARRSPRVGVLPCHSSSPSWRHVCPCCHAACCPVLFIFSCTFLFSAEAKDDDDGMSMLVDLAGAAAAAGAAGPAAADGSNGGVAAAEGARVKVTYSYFAVSSRLDFSCALLIAAPWRLSPGPLRALLRIWGLRGSSRPPFPPCQHPTTLGCLARPEQRAACPPAELHVPALPAKPGGRGPSQGGLQCRAGLAGGAHTR